jgi:hypothetical protein
VGAFSFSAPLPVRRYWRLAREIHQQAHELDLLRRSISLAARRKNKNSDVVPNAYIDKRA